MTQRCKGTESTIMQHFWQCSQAGGTPDDPGVDVHAPNDKAIHEEDAKQQQHATSISNHNLSGSCGDDSVDADPNLVGQEEQRQEHEEPAASRDIQDKKQNVLICDRKLEEMIHVLLLLASLCAVPEPNDPWKAA